MIKLFSMYTVYIVNLPASPDFAKGSAEASRGGLYLKIPPGGNKA